LSHRIFETESFSNDLESISKGGAKKIAKKLLEFVYPQLKNEPHFGPNIKRLRNWEPPTWRYRIGPWRFFYEIDDKEHVVYMTAAAHRSEAYRK